jgi:hypothetical protein
MPTSSKTPFSAHSVDRVCIGIILASALFAPADLAKRVAARATETRMARDQYTYRQTVMVEELGPTGARVGEYRETREVVFSPQAERSEKLAGKPLDTLKRLKLTEEDFRDIREVQPFLFDTDQLWAYETKSKGEETMDGVDCYLLQVRPRQILAGQRLFDGMLWVNKKDYSIVRTNGKAVPEIRSMTKDENLFPRFTTVWQPIDGQYWFPVHTFADDTLDFRVGPQRIRLTIRYSDYKKFGSDTTIKFD